MEIKNTLDKSKIKVSDFEGIFEWDRPDYSDAMISEAYIDGRELTDEELDELNEDAGFVHEALIEWMY